MKATRSLLLIAVPLVGIACAAEPATDSSEAPAAMAQTMVPAAGLEVATNLGVRNARMPIPGVVSAGQPTQEQLEAMRAAGFENFISLRPTSESGAGWEEAHSADGSYDFDRLPISGAGSLTRDNVERFAALLEAAGDEPTVLYCASSNRVGAMLALKAHWVDGVEAEAALELGLQGGMTRLEAPVRELLGLEPS